MRLLSRCLVLAAVGAFLLSVKAQTQDTYCETAFNHKIAPSQFNMSKNQGRRELEALALKGYKPDNKKDCFHYFNQEKCLALELENPSKLEILEKSVQPPQFIGDAIKALCDFREDRAQRRLAQVDTDDLAKRLVGNQNKHDGVLYGLSYSINPEDSRDLIDLWNSDDAENKKAVEAALGSYFERRDYALRRTEYLVKDFQRHGWKPMRALGWSREENSVIDNWGKSKVGGQEQGILNWVRDGDIRNYVDGHGSCPSGLACPEPKAKGHAAMSPTMRQVENEMKRQAPEVDLPLFEEAGKQLDAIAKSSDEKAQVDIKAQKAWKNKSPKPKKPIVVAVPPPEKDDEWGEPKWKKDMEKEVDTWGSP